MLIYRFWMCVAIIGFSTCISFPSYGSDTLTYKDAVRDALTNSSRLRIKAEDILISHAQYRQNFAGLFPEITINGRMERYENLQKNTLGSNTIAGEVVSGDQSAWRTSAYVSAQYYLSHWYKKRYDVSYYENMLDSQVYQYESEVKKILKELTDVFGGLGENRIKMRFSNDILNVMREALKLKKQAYEKGKIAYEEIVRLEKDVASEEKDQAMIAKDLKENLERLNACAEKTYNEDTDIESFVPEGLKIVSDLQKMVEEIPEYKAQNKALEALRQKAKSTAHNFWPDISFYGRYSFYGSSPNGLDGSMNEYREAAYNAGIMISIPIFDGGVRMWERRRQLHDIKRLEESVSVVRKDGGRDIRMLYAGYAELAKTLGHYRKLAEKFNKILDITIKANKLGERSYTDILDARKDVLLINRDLKITEHSLGVYEKRFVIETDLKSLINDNRQAGLIQNE